MRYTYKTLSTDLHRGVLTATISNPPVNVMTEQLYGDLVAFSKEVEADEAVKVLVLQSADPDFFIAHFDIEMIQGFPIEHPAQRESQLNDFHAMCERFRTMATPSLVKIAGRVGGGGNELCSACDMRFGLREKTVINQMEVPIGILPGGGGTQQLPRLIGRGRALELILGAEDLDADTAEQWGYLNRVFATQSALDTHVDNLARRIALWPPHAVALAKQSVLNAELPVEEGLKEEAFLFQQSLRYDAAQRNMAKIMALGGQTRDGELRIAELSESVGIAARDEQT